MGLDVYLYRYTGKTPAEAEALENALDARLDAELPYLAHETSTESDRAVRYKERDERRKEIASEFECGDGEYGGYNGKHCIKIDDPVYPDHYFKIGYCRSSYNEGGIDRVARSYFGLNGLYWVFDRESGDEYVFAPDWAVVKERALELAGKFRSRPHNVGVTFVGFNHFKDPSGYPRDAETALKAWTAKASENRQPFDKDSKRDWFGSADGDFFLGEPLKVCGAMPGFGSLGDPGVYLITDQSGDPDGGDEWYARACEIIARMSDHVLSQPDPENFYLHWSS